MFPAIIETPLRDANVLMLRFTYVGIMFSKSTMMYGTELEDRNKKILVVTLHLLQCFVKKFFPMLFVKVGIFSVLSGYCYCTICDASLLQMQARVYIF